MGLSYDLISEFVKITNDKKENAKEGTVYATVVSGTDGKYVRIDGSDLLTPMDTTTDIEDGERVTLMIKDHKAIVTGHVTTPSASTSKVDKVTESVNSVSDRVGTFELVVADKVSTNELEAYKATIEVLIANKATIEDLTATNAKIENLEVKNAEIENLVAEKATIEDLEAVNATIENLKVKDAEIENAVVENLKATTADIKILNADFAQIKTLVNGNLTSDNILSFNLTSEKVTVDDAFIKDAMIDTISAGKINAGEINTNLVSIGSEDGGMLITGSTQQFTDKNGNVRIQIGKDASGDFTFILYGEDGRGQLINQNGITASAISDGLIVNDMVSDHAAISGGKLDISSVITEINSDNSTTIQSSKIYLNDQAQSLEVAFNSLKTQVDTIQEVTIQGDLTAVVEQVQSNTSKIEANKNSINTLISEDMVIKKQVTDLQGTLNETETTLNSKYTSLNQNLDGFKTTVADTYATKKSVTDVVDNIESNYSTTSVMNSAIEQKAQEISASVSSTYATKNQVNTLDNNLKTNYSTTQQMESAINVAKEEINLGVSSIYETKENSTSKIQNAVNNIQVGGTNLLLNSHFDYDRNWSKGTGVTRVREGFDGGYCMKTVGALKNMRNFAQGVSITKLEKGQQYTATVWIKTQDIVRGTTNPLLHLHASYHLNNKWVAECALSQAIPNGTTAWTKYVLTFTMPTADFDVMTVAGYARDFTGTIWWDEIKLEKGNKASDWSPSPLDISTDITNAKTDAITSANNTLTSTISNYYTKSQTDSQINVAKNAINLGVSTTYETKKNVETKINNVRVGGTNLLWGTKLLTAGVPSSYISSDTYLGFKIMHHKQTADGFDDTYRYNSCITLEPNTEYTLSFYAKGSGGIYSFLYPDAVSSGINSNGATTDSIDGNIITTVTSEWKRYWITWKTLSNVSGLRNIIISRIHKGNDIYICGAKFEKGNKATEWSPAPEDIDTSINNAKTEAVTSANNTLTSTIANYYTKSQTDSQINVAKDAINLNVSNTYETKSNVESKVTSTLNSAKSYADTKKTEAISTASADATNKVNGIKIGGTNLLPNTKTLDGDWGKPNQIATDPIDGFTVYHAKGSSSAHIDFSFPNAIEPKPNTYYTLSFMAKGTGAFNSYFYPNAVASGVNSQGRTTTALDGSISSTLSNTYQKYWITWLTTSDVSELKSIIVSRLPNGTEIYVYGIKLEEGNKATDWNPSPEDVDSKISNIESETISIKESVSSLKLGADSINASVKSLEESMVNTTNGLANDISKVQDQVNLAMTSADVKLEIQKEMSKGTNKVTTSTGFTFDQNGLNISKTDSEMKTQITEDGMKIYKNSEVMLTANNQGVDAKNLHATTYLIIGNNSRMEDFTENGSKRTAVFWIG